MRRFRFLAALAASALFALPPLALAGSEPQQLTVSAAASLTDAFDELARSFESAQPGSSVRLNFAASGTLLQQIAQGAPVDVFASADQQTMDRALQQRLIDAGTRADFATNSLVLIEPAQGGPAVASLDDLADPRVQRIAVGKPATVPVGRYARQVLDNAELWSTLEPKFVQADSVRQVLDYVSRGEVDAGFVYRTDALIARNKVKVVEIALASHTPVRYPVAIVAESPQKALGRKFIDYLASDAAQQVLARYGFGRPRP